MRRVWMVVGIALLFSISVNAQSKVAQTPPMGWNSWNFFAEKVTDKDVRAAADQLVSTGMRDAGYVYVNIDDTWEGQRDASGLLHTNAKFPDMKALGDYIHSKGLKFGIYSSPGPKTCAGFEGSLNHEAQDAQMYADWGVDYVKYDLCSFIDDVMVKQAPHDSAAQMKLMQAAYVKMANAMKATGRPMVLSLCQYGWDAVWEWAPALGGNLWRTTDDVNATWDRIAVIGFSQAGLEKYAGPGHWNDPDMLEVGNGKLTLAENRAHFSLWAMLAAPLIAGNDLPNMKPEIHAILTNGAVIAIDQDALGAQGTRAYTEGEHEVWVRQLAGGAKGKGNCNSCHLDGRSTAPTPPPPDGTDPTGQDTGKAADVTPVFTCFGSANEGLPKNPRVAFIMRPLRIPWDLRRIQEATLTPISDWELFSEAVSVPLPTPI